jgi:hypothetical protein
MVYYDQSQKNLSLRLTLQQIRGHCKDDLSFSRSVALQSIHQVSNARAGSVTNYCDSWKVIPHFSGPCFLI